jgi:hypothetical protein
MADCKTYREEIEELAGVGRLSLGARAHVNACEACRGVEHERASLRRLVRGLERVEAPSDFEFRLRARMNASRAAASRNTLRPVYGFAALAAAACFLFVSASLYVRQERQNKPGGARQQVVMRESAGGETESGQEIKEVKPEQEIKVAQVSDAGLQSVVGLGTRGVRSEQGRVRTRAISPPRAREAASRGPSGEAPAQNFLTAGLSSARVIEQSPTMRVSLGTSAEPLRVVLRDGRGETRVVPMRSVSFGSQELIAREGVSRRAAVTDKEGVW